MRHLHNLERSAVARIFEYHILESLLFYSGFSVELLNDPNISPSFSSIDDLWDVEMRYDDPANPKFQNFNNQLCVDVDRWLNDATVGVVPWLRNRI